MNKYLITVESQEYNPIKHEWEAKQFSGEFEAKSERGAKIEAKNIYANELDTEPSEIKIIKCELFEDIIFTVMMLTDDVAMTIFRDLDESVDELIEKFDGDIIDIKNYLRDKYDIPGLFI